MTTAVDGCHHNTTTMSDLDKLTSALSHLPSLTDPTSLLEAFGLTSLPQAQKYGILLGILTFTLTVGTVLTLLTLGGTWKRIELQEKSGEVTTAPDSVVQRKKRALILERLLENRYWMIQRYNEYSEDDKITSLNRLLMTTSPKNESDVTPTYKVNYTKAYKQCQDRPGGEILGGLPESRFESYARAYAGCGERTSLHYRWSYARMYENTCCKSHETVERYQQLWKERGGDVIGVHVRLEGLDEGRHAREFYEITNGSSYGADKQYDPEEVWGFLEYGPFLSEKSLMESPLFQLQRNQAGFAIVDMITDRLLGLVQLTNDDPKNLNVQLELPITKPSSQDTLQITEACFLLLDRLFAYGYRRVQISIDTQDVRAKRLPRTLGFTQEGQIPKHRIIKEANRDSILYGMLNSDWDGGARGVLFKKLYGEAMLKTDRANRGKEEKAEEEERKLAEQKEVESKKKT
jgi:RimJ/RimL family protein N-acetyltransferase